MSDAWSDGITLEIMWNRLTAIVDEMAADLVRTSFSTVLREANDFACTILDADGNSVVQSSESIPAFIGTIPRTVKAFLAQFGREGLAPGDALITNDPWLGSGHLPDITMAVPVFDGDELIAFMASTAHSPDVGGRLRSADSREIYEEGLFIPPLKFRDRGVLNPTLESIIRANVRVPELTLGDLHALVTGGVLGARRLLEFLAEYDLDDLAGLGAEVQSRSEAAMRRAITRVPDGTYYGSVMADGYGEPLELKLRLDVAGDELTCDYAGSSPEIDMALNCVLNYTYAYTAYPIKALLDPETPNNEGSFRPISVTAPEGSILNCTRTAAVGGRVMIGHYLHAAVFDAFADALPDEVQAESGSPLWGITFTGKLADGSKWTHLSFMNGGQGASPHLDGISTMSFPSNISNTPVEVIEQTTPVLIHEKSFLVDSGGPGRRRGGLGQHMVIEIASEGPITATFLADRTKFPPKGVVGGKAGATGRILLNGEQIDTKRQHVLAPGDILELFLPGGGGHGDPGDRDPAHVRADVAAGLVSAEQAREAYGYEGDLAAAPAG